VRLVTEAIVCAVRAHGEHGAIVRALTPADGLQAGFVRGGRSRRLRPVLMAGNLVQAEYRARTEEQLAQLTVELTESRGALLSEPLAAAAIDWATALSASTLPEGRGWAAALVRFELLLLSQLGYGLDLSECAATGAIDDLAFVSPKSGRAVSRAGAGAYADRLMKLPAFLLSGGAADWPEIHDGLRITGHFLGRDLLVERQSEVLAARERLLERLRRAAA
jgi:DNA repair protein RecO (recombination protein O)